MPGRLVPGGGFTVTDSQQRHLQQQARRLGFADLSACLQVLLDDGWSIPQLATHLDTTQAIVRRAIADHHIPQPCRRQQLARQRQRAARQRAADRAAARRARLRRTGRLPPGPVCLAGLAAAAAVRRARRWL